MAKLERTSRCTSQNKDYGKCSKISNNIIPNNKIVSEYDHEQHYHKQQTKPWHREEEPRNHETPGRQTKQSNELSLSSSKTKGSINKISNSRFLQKGIDKQDKLKPDCFWTSSQICVSRTCYSDKQFVNSNTENPHFDLSRKRQVIEILEHLPLKLNINHPLQWKK